MYVLDTNVFIDAANAYYAFDLAPGYWDFLVHLFSSHHAVSIKSVYDELGEAGDGDPLKGWAKQNKQHFIAPDSRVVARYQQVMKWAEDNYEAPAVREFRRVADSWIVAHALANGWVVVTHEKSAPRSKKRIKIPDACAALGVECLNPFTMLRGERMCLVL